MTTTGKTSMRTVITKKIMAGITFGIVAGIVTETGIGIGAGIMSERGIGIGAATETTAVGEKARANANGKESESDITKSGNTSIATTAIMAAEFTTVIPAAMAILTAATAIPTAATVIPAR